VSDLTPAPPLLPRLARNATAQFAARLTASLAQALALVLVARTLGPSTYGLFAIVTTLTVMATVVAEWGLPLIATRLIAGGGLEARAVLAAGSPGWRGRSARWRPTRACRRWPPGCS
jgi:hypothetical protein